MSEQRLEALALGAICSRDPRVELDRGEATGVREGVFGSSVELRDESWTHGRTFI